MDHRFWHVAQNGKEEGPFSVEDIYSKIKDGSITSDAYVFKIGTHEWVPITDRKEFVDWFSTPPPPPPIEAISGPTVTTKSLPVKHEQDSQGVSRRKDTRSSTKPIKSFRRLIGRFLLAAALGMGGFYISRGSTGAAGIAATLGLALGASPTGWLSTAIGAVGLKVAYESYEPKPYCIYFSDSKVVGSIKSLSNQCYSDRKECMDAVPFHAASGYGQYVGCWNTCNNLDTYNCKIRTLMEGHRAR